MRRDKDNGRTPGSDRRRELIQIAYRHIVEKGFEGLRVRDIAQEAGINNATLHYYFPTKEALIQGVVEHLIQEFSTERLPRSHKGAQTPLEELRREFEDLGYRFHKMPDMFVALVELAVRSRRDPAIAEILKQLDDGWRSYLIGILERGMREGVFRKDLDVAGAATSIMVQFKGIGYQLMQNPNEAQIDLLVAEMADQVERWLTG